MPKRSRSGFESRLQRVVAPTSVNGASERRSARAPAPCPTMMSIERSSIAEYRSSSTIRLNRWISSTNSTSPSPRPVRIAARSPFRSIAGPETLVSAPPVSAAMMCARVVLPRPGGPSRSTWSSGSPRAAAAPRKTASCSRTWLCPTNSASRSGRSVRAGSSSPATSSGTVRRSSLIGRPPAARARRAGDRWRRRSSRTGPRRPAPP